MSSSFVHDEIHILVFFYHFTAYNIETMSVTLMILGFELLHGNMVPHSLDPSFTF